ncbi:PREDICTED: elongation factor 1-delta isoform X1 [Sturnus vulgaris]|uniref:elongation factor 1-delta isoform X1 n=1 Tax=Sturnus vulgaris TaxID=9172 RepID=UPI00071AA40A|nr:PREDICTED: elongation factor 1-delta isoform X1 [Sturnus vulgaris]
MRTRKNPCSVDKVWLEKHRNDEAEREAPEPEAINGICHEDSIEGEFKGDPKKPRNGKKQRKRKRSPKPKAQDSKLEAILAGMSAEHVWFDKPLYDRAESAYRRKLADSQSWESPETGKMAQESPAVARSKSSHDIPKARMLPACSHGSLAACHHIVQGVWINKFDFDKAERAFMEKSQFFIPPNVLAIPSVRANSRLGTPDEGYGTALPTPATPGLAPNIPNSPVASIPSLPSSDQQTVNGKPQISNWEVLASEVWLEKPLYDDAEKNFYEKMLDGHPLDKTQQRQRGCPEASKIHNNHGKQTEIATTNPQLPDIPKENPTSFFLHKDSESVWLNKVTYDRAESRYFALEAARAAEKTEIQESAAENPSHPAAPSIPAPEMKKMAVDYFLHDKIWFEKYKYDDAERRFYEQMNGPMGAPSRQQENGASTILRDIARARENIQKSLAGQQKTPARSKEAPCARPKKQSGRSTSASTSSSGAAGDQNELLSRISHLEVENQNLRSVVADLQMAIFKLESRLNALEKSSTSHQPSPVPPTQKVEPFSVPSKKVELPAKKSEPAAAEEDEDDDIDLFGSDDEEEDQEAAKVREERLRQYAEKKAKKPGLIAKSSILLDVKPWDDETDMAKMEECVRSIHMDGLVWGASKLVPVGYGIKKLQIQCVVEDEKVGTDILEEEITKFEDYVQSVDIAAFNKI